jgi:transcriptional regulator with XRE-family HTH domain
MTWRGVGDRIRMLREARGLSRRALAEKVGLSEVFIKKVEAGERLPSLPNLDLIARVFGATLTVKLVGRRTRRKGGQHGRQG